MIKFAPPEKEIIHIPGILWNLVFKKRKARFSVANPSTLEPPPKGRIFGDETLDLAQNRPLIIGLPEEKRLKKI